MNFRRLFNKPVLSCSCVSAVMLKTCNHGLKCMEGSTKAKNLNLTIRAVCINTIVFFFPLIQKALESLCTDFNGQHVF